MARGRRPTFAHFITNWERSDLPYPKRLVLGIKNLSLRLVRRDVCCGHDGEPGC